jgi:MYXO-CTERM domain-containing protein
MIAEARSPRRVALRLLLTVGAGALASLLVSARAEAATLQVGPGKTYAKPCAAIAMAKAGDVIEVDAAGSYAGDTCAWSTDNLTVRGVGGRAKIDLTGVTPAQQKGIFTIAAANATIENFELSGAAISAGAGNNGAGIRHQGLNLTVRNCYFHDNQNGILGAPSTADMGNVLIERSEFAHNGAGDGYSHNMYLGNYAQLTLQYSYSHRGNVGHLVKSRAHVNFVLYNRITDEDGTASYEVDLPNGGTGYVIGNLIEQAATTQNPGIVTFAEEGVPAGYDTHLYVVNNTILNQKKTGTFVVDPSTTPALIQNNVFWNGGTITSQASAVQTSNFDSSKGDPKFVDVARYDVHLAAGSPCIDKGTAPGSAASGQALAPMFEYVHPLGETARATAGAALDQGAYEYGNTGASDAGAADSGVADTGAGDANVGDAGADASPPGDDAAVADAASDADLGDASPAGGGDSTSGCGCRLGPTGDGAGLGAASVLAAAVVLSRRRRRRA